MTQDELLFIAHMVIEKNMDYEELYYSDYIYGKESYTDDVWEYVVECREIGTKSFYKKYWEEE